jgi:hypothetical protein
MSSNRRTILLGVAVLAVLSGAATTLVLDRSDDVDAVAIWMDEARYSTSTASDWVTYADHVVVATVVSEKQLDAVRMDDNFGVLIRSVTLEVDDVLWSRDEPSAPMTQSLTMQAMGWSYPDGDTSDLTRNAVEDSPRLEIGHTYIVALDWVPARCDVGDDPEPAGWVYLGSDAVLPYDDGAIGKGELEGREQTVAEVQATSDPSDPNFSFEDSMLGKSAAELAAVLAAASPSSRAHIDRDEARYACDGAES